MSKSKSVLITHPGSAPQMKSFSGGSNWKQNAPDVARSGNIVSNPGQEDMSRSVKPGSREVKDMISLPDKSLHSGLGSATVSEKVSPERDAQSRKKSNSIKGQSDWLAVPQTNKGGAVGRQSLSSSFSLDRASD